MVLPPLDFSGPISGGLLERHFNEETKLRHAIRHRSGLLITACVMFAVGIVEAYRALGTLSDANCAPLCLPHVRLPLVVPEMGVFLVCLVALALTYVAGSSLRQTERFVVVLSYVMVGVAITFASAESMLRI